MSQQRFVAHPRRERQAGPKIFGHFQDDAKRMQSGRRAAQTEEDDTAIQCASHGLANERPG
ncbi:hypothetical protein [Bradyrhizobium sp. 33ap4]|uniref:hypothetical protein n=1 Tax=Bradyrhizobium sp. 33ap4 TaxID=3061630 RepID=UPI00292DA4E9|nr:hypothetical protein [Bradyrhizobium sp. 33ap4]